MRWLIMLVVFICACSGKQAASDCPDFRPPTQEEVDAHVAMFGCPPCPCGCVRGRIECASCPPCDSGLGDDLPGVGTDDDPPMPADAGAPDTTAPDGGAGSDEADPDPGLGSPIPTHGDCGGWKPPTAQEKAEHLKTFGCPICPCACVAGELKCAPCARCAGELKKPNVHPVPSRGTTP